MFSLRTCWCHFHAFRRPTELKLALCDERKRKKEEYMGYVTVQCTLKPKSQDEKEAVSFSPTITGNPRPPSREWPIKLIFPVIDHHLLQGLAFNVELCALDQQIQSYGLDQSLGLKQVQNLAMKKFMDAVFGGCKYSLYLQAVSFTAG